MSPQLPETLDVEVFRAGDYGAKGRYDENHLDAIAGDYDAARHEAPVTIDHRQDGPAEGWVRAVRRVGDRLVATLAGLSPRLRELLSRGAYRKRSVELYRALASTGRPYLKAVSFLGAAAPEVKGLADPVFAEEPAALELFDDAAPAVDFGEAARRRLVDARRWHPAWEQLGLVEVFRAIGNDAATADRLHAVLSAWPEPVAFGAADTAPSPEGREPAFQGAASPESVRLHRAALAFQAAHPTVSYREALVRASAEQHPNT